MDTALGAANWVLGMVLDKLSGDLVAGYVASKELGLNYGKIRTELRCTQALLHEAQQRDAINNPGLQGLLEDLKTKGDEADNALDELHYFMIRDKLDGTREATPDLGEGLRNQALHAVRHAVDVGKSYLPTFSRSRKQDDAGVISCPRDTKRAKSSNSSGYDRVDKLSFDRVAMSNNIKSLVEDMNSLCARITPILQLHCTSNPPRKGATLKRPPTSSTITQDKLYGRDAIFSQTTDYMTSDMHRETLSVLPIVGPGGIGKTTFAQHLYNHEKTKERFPIRVWVCVSTNFDVLRLTQQILRCILAAEKQDNNQANNTSNLSLLHESIAQRLKSKDFLIVFDDIWDCKNKTDWDTLLAPFRKGETRGNIVLVTTRFPKIANMVKKEGTNPINLQGLEADGFWEFFQECAFGEVRDEKGKDNLVDIARAISDKLKRSPLAAKTVGPLLRSNQSREHWNGILNKKEWENLKRSDDDIMPALRISYDYLPFHLKKCFSYCALFPEDHRFDTTELTCFWDAIGIIDTSRQKDRVQDLVDELVDNGFLMKQQDNGSSQHYMLHDLLHELSRIVSSQECLNISFPGFIANKIPQSVRHVSVTIQNKCFQNLEEEMIKVKTMIDIANLISLMIFGSYESKKMANVLKDTFNEISKVRVLFVFMNSTESLPLNFSKLIHLRYLKMITLDSHVLSNKDISLPNSISGFYHLNVLNLENWHGRNDVPEGFNHLVNLRHIYHSDNYRSNEFHSNIPGVGKMGCLEELNQFHAKKESAGFELAELENLRKLRGSLTICGLDKVRTKEEAGEAKLQNKCNLRKLSLVFIGDWFEKESLVFGRATTGHDPIEGLQPHPSLKELEIINHSGPTGPSWLCRDICFTSLEKLFLVGISWDTLPPFGRLPFLINLSLSEIHGMDQLRLTDGSFKHLKEINISHMPDLIDFVMDDNSHLLSRLESIICTYCPNLTVLPFYDCIGPSTEGTDITWFPNLHTLRIIQCPKVPQLPLIPHTSTLRRVGLTCLSYRKVGNTSKLHAKGYSGALAFHNMGNVEYMSIGDGTHVSLTDLQKLNSLRALTVSGDMFSGELGDNVVLSSVQKLELSEFHPTEMLLSNIFNSLPALSELDLIHSDGGRGEVVLQFPSSSLLRLIKMHSCKNLVLSAEDGGSFRNLTSLDSLTICSCNMIFSQWSLVEASEMINLFPASIRKLSIRNQQDMRSMALPSNLTSLTILQLNGCPNLTMEGFNPLIVSNLESLEIIGCGSVATEILSEAARPKTTVPAGSWQLKHLSVDSIAAVLVAPVCLCISATLCELYFGYDETIERLTEEQEKALQLLTTLEKLTFYECGSLRSLPEALHRLCSLKELVVSTCEKIQSLPISGLPTSLEYLDASSCNDELSIKVRELEESHPDLVIHF